MTTELEAYFEDDEQRRAYEAFCAEQERGLEKFNLDAPVLVCRWRMANKKVPLLNRHIRALAARRVMGKPLTHNMLSWAKQHVEWSLAEGSYAERDGVLMLVIDVNGNAAMTVGSYEPLADASLAALTARAETARAERAEADVAPELLGAVAGGRVLLAATPDDALCGAASLLAQVAKTRGHEVACVLPTLDGAGADALDAGTSAASASSAGVSIASEPVVGSAVEPVPDAVSLALTAAALPLVEALRAEAGGEPAFFLVSDEHGVVPAAENAAANTVGAADAALVATLAADCRKLFA